MPQTFKLEKKPDQGVEQEWDRLMKEREELLQTGCYGKDDLLIRELDR